MIPRHFDYMLRVATVPVGGVFGVPLGLESDAPFALRLVRSRNIGPSGFRWQTPAKQWQSNALRTDVVFGDPVNIDGSRPTGGIVVYPQMIYPEGGQIVVDIGNTTGAALTDVSILFRGSKLFRDGSIPSPTYPASGVIAKPFTYQVIVNNVAASSQILNNSLQVKPDSDFVLRCAVCDPFAVGADGGVVGGAPVNGVMNNPLYQNFENISVILRDEGRKAYSNVPIPLDWLFGQGRPFPQSGQFASSGLSNFPNVAFMPGLFTPEIYLPRQHALYWDLFRDDSNIWAPINLWFRFVGAKIY